MSEDPQKPDSSEALSRLFGSIVTEGKSLADEVSGNAKAVARSALTNLSKQVEARHPRTNIEHQMSLLAQRKRELQQLIQGSMRRFRGALEQQEQLIRTLGPENTLARGYALVTGPDGRIIRNAKDAPPKSEVRIQLAKGELAAKIIDADTPGKGVSD